MEEELPGLRHKPLLVPILFESDEEMLHARTVREIQIASNFAVLKSSAPTWNNDIAMPSAKRFKTATTEKEQQRYDLAIETAVLVQKEIEQWENSIRELELMLSSQEEHQQRTNPLSYVADSFHAHESIDSSSVIKSIAPIAVNRSNSEAETRVAAVIEKDNVVDEAPVVWEASSTLLPTFEISTATISSASSSST